MSDFSALFRSTEEVTSPIQATVTGQIPTWLNGTFIRIGPGKFDLSDGFVLNHWFDGYGVLINFHIEDGKVTFLKKFVQSDAYKKAVTVGRPVFAEYGTKAYPDPSKSIFSRLKTALIPELSDSNSVNIFRIEDSVFVATETTFIHRVDPFTLETKEKVDLSKSLPITMACSHHYKDQLGCTWTLATSVGGGGFQHHIVNIPQAPDGKATTALKMASIIADFSPAWKTSASHYHSFAMSTNYIIFVEQPMVISMMKIASMQVKARSFKDCCDWRPEELNRFVVFDKTSGKILPVTIKSDNVFYFIHHINAFERAGHLVLDTVIHDSPEINEKLFIEKLRQSKMSDKDPSRACRFVIPLQETYKDQPQNVNLVKLDNTTATAILKEQTLYLTGQPLGQDTGFELPTINPRYFGSPYRYFYCSGMQDPGRYRNTLAKVDTETQEVVTWKQDDYTYPGEMLFVSSPNSSSEDDGILLSAMTDVRSENPDCLLFIDAKTMTEIARASVDAHVPDLIHGIFISREDSKSIKC